MTAMAKPASDILRAYLKGRGIVKVYEEPSQELLLQVASGYRFKALGSEGAFQRVELHCGKVGYVRNDQVVQDRDYPEKRTHTRWVAGGCERAKR